jgi:acetyl esterase/lipase
MPLDPKARAILDADDALNLPPRHTLSPVEARIQKNARPPATEEPVEQIQDRTIAVDGGRIALRFYRPAGEGPQPALVFFHGGGWVVGSIVQTEATCRVLANRAHCTVFSVDYRLAPEFKFPTAAEDCLAATRWVADNAEALGVDPARIAIGGLSAGGNLAAVVALMARERGGPRICFQFLGYPITDYDFETRSYLENSEGFGLSRADMVWFWNHYLTKPEDGMHPYVSPMRAELLSNLPPALVVTAEFDPLRDEGEAYAERLREAGVEVVCTRYAGMIHGFVGMAHLLEGGQQAIDQLVNALNAAFAGKAAAATGD